MSRLLQWLSELPARMRALFRGATERATLERDMREEFEHHIAARADDLMRGGLAAEDAARQARREFGHANTHRMDARDAMGLTPLAQLRFSWLDVRLALRILGKHPMLNIAAVIALAVGIPVGLAPAHLARALEASLPSDAEGRVRAIRHWDPLFSRVAPTSEADFARWAARLKSFTAVAAFRSSLVGVAVGDAGRDAGAAQGSATASASLAQYSAAQVSASLFPMLDARPRLGRTLDPRDYDAGAPDVVVIGHGLWTAQFARDPNVIGRPLRIGRRLYDVVGVMPDGFAFPSNEALWLPLRAAESSVSAERTRVQVIARLADAASTESAQAELAAVGIAPLVAAQAASEIEARTRLRGEVVPFSLLFLGLPAGGLDSLPEFRLVQLLMFSLLLVACGNVAMLIFARTATRLRELAIRNALGASRTRIVSQIFVEALVLAIVGAGIGVLAVDWVMGRVNIAQLAGESALPYWLSLDLTSRTVFSAMALAAVSATVAGVVPAIIITGRDITAHLSGASRVRFGKLTAALVVADIAVSVAAVGMAFAVSQHATDLRVRDEMLGVPAAEYLAMELRVPDESVSDLATDQREFVAALEREPGVRSVAVSDALPGMDHRSRPYELDNAATNSEDDSRWVRSVNADVNYFTALDAPMLQGRNFERSDADSGARVVIVNSAFVTQALGGGEAVGRRVRFPSDANASDAQWYEIIGVVGHLGVNVMNAERGEAVYIPTAPGQVRPLRIAVRSATPPAQFVGRAREIARDVNPDIVIEKASVLSDLRQADWYLVMGVALGLIVLATVLIALATSGLYAMLSLAVSERTREIGIRSALGASRGSLLLTILKRPLMQMGLGALLGLPLAARFVFELSTTPGGSGTTVGAIGIALALTLGIVLFVAISSCLVPMRRILGIEASVAMRAES
jgi:putative ABC transport system permease protein